MEDLILQNKKLTEEKEKAVEEKEKAVEEKKKAEEEKKKADKEVKKLKRKLKEPTTVKMVDETELAPPEQRFGEKAMEIEDFKKAMMEIEDFKKAMMDIEDFKEQFVEFRKKFFLSPSRPPKRVLRSSSTTGESSVNLLDEETILGPARKCRKTSSAASSVVSTDSKKVLPPFENDSISTVAKSKGNKDVFLHQPLYSYWYAISLYNLMLDLKQKMQNENDVKVEFLGRSYEIKRELLKKQSVLIQQLCQPPAWDPFCLHGYLRDEHLRKCEMTYSALFSSSLNKLIPQGTDAEFIHQGPIRKTAYAHGNPEVADIIGCEHDTGRYVFVSDLKITDLQLAERETALYAKHASLNKIRDSNSCSMILGLAGTTQVAGMRLYLMAEKKMWALPIFDDVPWGELLLAAIAIAVANLVNTPWEHVALDTPVPFKNEMSPMKNSAQCRVFWDNTSNEIYKVFCRSDPTYSSNIELMKEVGIVVTEGNLTNDSKYYYIKYQRYPGNHTPNNLKQFGGIFSMLGKVHDADYVHGDIRLQNLIFDGNKKDSYLLDYDLAKKNGKGRYPPGYCCDISVRHPNAKRDRLMDKRHDRHALKQILLDKFGTEAKCIADQLDTDDSLSKIAESLLNL